MIPWSGLHSDDQASYQINVASTTKRSPASRVQLDPSHGTGLGLRRSCDDHVVLERFSICTDEQGSYKKDAVVLRLETAFKAADATPSLKYRGIKYLRQNGFVAIR